MSKQTVDIIKEDIEEAILLGEFSNGDRLDEVRLSEKHNVSRTPIREALRLLAALGLVELIPNRGAFVRFPSIREIVEMFEVMGELESLAAKLAARRITDEQMASLNQACDACAQAQEAQDHQVYYQQNERFHHLIYKASANTFLIGEAKKLYRRLHPIRRMQLQARGRLEQSMNEHIAIRNAIANGNGEMAAQLLREHVLIQGEKFSDLLVSFEAENRRKTG